jgi:hypothetical protein
VHFDTDREAVIQSVSDAAGYNDDDRRKLEDILAVGVSAYARQRTEDTIWKLCEGKQVMNYIAVKVGFGGAPALIQATFAAWDRGGVKLPEEVVSFREYLGSL